MIQRLLPALLLLSLACHLTNAQSPVAQFTWANEFTGGALGPTYLEVDRSDNILFAATYFSHPTSPRAVVYQDDTLLAEPNPTFDVVVVKLDSAANLLWLKRFQGDQDIQLGGFEIDDQNNLLFWLRSEAPVEYDSLSFPVGTNVVKLTSDGDYLWRLPIRGASLPFGFESMSLDCANNIVVAGHITQHSTGVVVDTFLAPPDTILVYEYEPDTLYLGAQAFAPPGPDGNMFVAKIDPDGAPLWTRLFAGNQSVEGVAADYGSSVVVLITAFVAYPVFDGLTVPIDTNTYYNPVLLQLDETGAVEWARTYFPTTRAYDIERAPDGSLYISGYFYLKTQEGNVVVTSSGVQDAILFKLDPNGTLEWANAVGDQYTNQISALAVSKNNEVIISGYAINSGEMARRFAPDGQVQWKLPDSCNGNLASGEFDFDSQGNAVHLGRYNGTFVIGPNTFSIWGGPTHTYLLKFSGQDIPGSWLDCQFVQTATETPEAALPVRIFPNPATDVVFIESSLSLGQIRLFDLQGRLLRTVDSNDATRETILLNELPPVFVVETGGDGRGTAEGGRRAVIVTRTGE